MMLYKQSWTHSNKEISNMKKEKWFEKPEAILINFQNEDIITDSVLGSTDEGDIEVEA